MVRQKVKVQLASRASRDLEEIYQHLAQHSLQALEQVDKKIFKALQRLETFPESGHSVSEWRSQRYREVLVYHYRIIYRYREKAKQVNILTIRHGRRYLPAD
jgi:toxin ParE1/3/4